MTPIEALAVNILKRTNVLSENTVFLEVDPCLLYREGLYLPQEFLPFKEFTLASCEHIYHQKCLEKYLGSQDKPTTLIAEDTATKQVDSENPTPIGEDADAIYINKLGLLGEEDCSSKTTEIAKETSDRATSSIEESTLVEQSLNDIQKKRSREDSEGIKSDESTKKLSSKKAKKTELLSDMEPIPSRSLEETNDMALNTRGIFLQLSDKIDSVESKNKDASRALISSYFNFGEALFNRYKELKPTYGKEGARALVKSEVRKEIFKTKLSEDALRKRIERV
ncbi:ATP dependent DNA helicase [Gigaspora margarita]|uniref:ATP dependent DNA helicase n=1 Tax=Gigaspora margarita TaxID=4874 RepID=A0A8H4AA56_GIGMA|nr:ATP dependent DNA helicase [Gigaspora margarita]